MMEQNLKQQLIIELGRMTEYLAVAADDSAYDQEIESAWASAQAQALTK